MKISCPCKFYVWLEQRSRIACWPAWKMRFWCERCKNWHTSNGWYSLAREARCGWMWSSFSSTAAGRWMVRSHQASSGRKMYDHAAERARRWGGVAWRRTSAGWAVGLLDVMVPVTGQIDNSETETSWCAVLSYFTVKVLSKWCNWLSQSKHLGEQSCGVPQHCLALRSSLWLWGCRLLSFQDLNLRTSWWWIPCCVLCSQWPECWSPCCYRSTAHHLVKHKKLRFLNESDFAKTA